MAEDPDQASRQDPHQDPDHPYQANSPEEILFNENLRIFTVKVGQICGLEANGKIAQGEAYQRIRDLWRMLKKSKKNLRIGKDDSEPAG